MAALRVPGIDPIDVALPALLNDLSGTDAKQTLILDDYHMLTDARIHEGVEYLLSYLPPSLRLVIAGRLDPPLPLARMRARGELTEIRAADLRFSPAEAHRPRLGGKPVDAGPDVVDPLVDRTEGWAVGLKTRRADHSRRTRPGRACGRSSRRRPTTCRLPHLGGARPPAHRSAGLPGPYRGLGPLVRFAV